MKLLGLIIYGLGFFIGGVVFSRLFWNKAISAGKDVLDRIK